MNYSKQAEHDQSQVHVYILFDEHACHSLYMYIYIHVGTGSLTLTLVIDACTYIHDMYVYMCVYRVSLFLAYQYLVPGLYQVWHTLVPHCVLDDGVTSIFLWKGEGERREERRERRENERGGGKKRKTE